MTKKEIITVAAHAAVPEGASLVERDGPFGKVACVTADSPAGTLELAIAQQVERCITTTLKPNALPATPDFFRDLHVYVDVYRDVVIATAMEGVKEEDLIGQFKLIVKKIRSLAQNLGIEYEIPLTVSERGDD